jgi:hypothetical protein
MVTILSAIVSIFEFRVRSRASLELELIALRHQVTSYGDSVPVGLSSSLDRLLWVWLYPVSDAQHRWAIRVLDLDPALRSSGAAGCRDEVPAA